MTVDRPDWHGTVNLPALVNAPSVGGGTLWSNWSTPTLNLPAVTGRRVDRRSGSVTRPNWGRPQLPMPTPSRASPAQSQSGIERWGKDPWVRQMLGQSRGTAV